MFRFICHMIFSEHLYQPLVQIEVCKVCMFIMSKYV